MTDEEFEELWQQIKENDKRKEEEWNKLSPYEQEHFFDDYDKGFIDRMTDDIGITFIDSDD